MIAANEGSGVEISGSGTTANLVNASFIGTNDSGDLGLGNAGYGVLIDDSASGNYVGAEDASLDATSGAPNVIYPNALGAVSAPDGNSVVENTGIIDAVSGTAADLTATLSGDLSTMDFAGTLTVPSGSYDVAIYAYQRGDSAADATSVATTTATASGGLASFATSALVADLPSSTPDCLFFAVLNSTTTGGPSYYSAPAHYYSTSLNSDLMVVTSLTEIDGVGSLRGAINQVNTNSESLTTTIDFELPMDAIYRPQTLPIPPGGFFPVSLPAFENTATVLGNGVTLDMSDNYDGLQLDVGDGTATYAVQDINIQGVGSYLRNGNGEEFPTGDSDTGPAGITAGAPVNLSHINAVGGALGIDIEAPSTLSDVTVTGAVAGY